jgi:hypothetical protein
MPANVGSGTIYLCLDTKIFNNGVFMKISAIVMVPLIAGTMLSFPLLAQAASDNLSEAQLLQRVDQDQDKANQAADSGAITQEQADADNARISDIRAKISKTHKKYHGLIPHKELAGINKALGSLESKEKSQEAQTAKHKSR